MLNKLLTKVEDLDTKFGELIKSNDFISDQYKTANVKINQLTSDTTKMSQEILELKCENQLLHKINGNLLDRVLKLETNDRKLNLIIDGIKEQYNETEDTLYREII